MSCLAESLAAVRAEEADDLAARLAEAKLHLAELEAVAPGSHQSQAAVSKASDTEQTRQWLPRAISDAASAAMYPTAKLHLTQVSCVGVGACSNRMYQDIRLSFSTAMVKFAYESCPGEDRCAQDALCTLMCSWAVKCLIAKEYLTGAA